MKILGFCLLLFVVFRAKFVGCDQYDDGVIFNVYKDSTSSFVWKPSTALIQQGCEKDGKFSFIAHGWQGSKAGWMLQLVQKLQKYRQGCIINIDWGTFADITNYDKIVRVHFPRVSAVLAKRLKQLEAEGVPPDNIYMYGHSLGARVVIEAGLKFGERKIGLIDACDAAGPEFLIYDARVTQRNAAQNVQCIHTSMIGTMSRDCDQDWIMGKCGLFQQASDPLGVLSGNESAQLSHPLCNDFYISAFENAFVANNAENCRGVSKNLPTNFRMGYMETRKSSSIRGIIASPTSKYPPYN